MDDGDDDDAEGPAPAGSPDVLLDLLSDGEGDGPKLDESQAQHHSLAMVEGESQDDNPPSQADKAEDAVDAFEGDSTYDFYTPEDKKVSLNASQPCTGSGDSSGSEGVCTQILNIHDEIEETEKVLKRLKKQQQNQILGWLTSGRGFFLCFCFPRCVFQVPLYIFLRVSIYHLQC